MESVHVAADSHISSAVAFVDGGVQDPCEDACSICFEDFCDSNPATVTSCKHEYHLQCILEWYQRSKECPMCWQTLSLKDPNSQELLDAVQHERPYHRARRMTSIMQRNLVDEFDVHEVPDYVDFSNFEEQIMQHLAAAARAHHFARRELSRDRQSSVQDHANLMEATTYPSPQVPLVGDQVAIDGNYSPLSAVGPAIDRPQQHLVQHGGQLDAAAAVTARRSNGSVRLSETSSIESCAARTNTRLETTEESQHRSGPSDFLTFSESLKSRLAAASSRYKETFTKTTRGFKEKLRARNNIITDFGARAREVSAGVAQALERISLESVGKSRENDVPTTSSNTSGLDELPTLNEVEISKKPEANMGIDCATNSLGSALHGVATSRATQPGEDAGSGFGGTSSKDIEGSSGGGEPQGISAVASPS